MKYYFMSTLQSPLSLVIYLNFKPEINIALPFAICICQSLPLLVAISIKLSKQETIHKRTMAKAKAQTPSSVPHPVSGSRILAPRKATPSQTPKSFHCHWPGIVSRRLKTRQLHYSCGQNPPARSTKMTFQCAGSNETEPNPNPPRQFHMQMTKMNLINNCLSIHLTSSPHTCRCDALF